MKVIRGPDWSEHDGDGDDDDDNRDDVDDDVGVSWFIRFKKSKIEGTWSRRRKTAAENEKVTNVIKETW